MAEQRHCPHGWNTKRRGRSEQYMPQSPLQGLMNIDRILSTRPHLLQVLQIPTSNTLGWQWTMPGNLVGLNGFRDQSEEGSQLPAPYQISGLKHVTIFPT